MRSIASLRARVVRRTIRWIAPRAAVLVGAACVPAGQAPGAHTPAPIPAAVRLPAREGWITTDDSVRLFYRVLGSGGDTVVVLHGGPGFHFNYLAPDLTPLAAHHTLVFFDQRNAGRSTLLDDTARVNARLLVADVEAVRRHLRLERVTLLGHSWGGLLAGLYAAEHAERVRRLVLVGALAPRAALMRDFNPMARLDSTANLAREANLRAFRAGGPDSTKACWDYYALWARGYSASPVESRRLFGDMCDVPQAAMRRANASYPLQSLGAWDLTARLARVTAPVLVVHGDRDPVPLAAAEAWTRALPDARLFVIPGAAHLPYDDRPAAFFTGVEAFLAGRWPDATALAASGAAVVHPGDAHRSAYAALRATFAAVEDTLVARIARQDWEGVAEVYAPGAVIFAPGSPPITTRPAIASFWRTAAKRGLRTMTLQLLDVEASGDLALATGRYTMTGAGDRVLDVGKFLAAYWREGDRWVLSRDVFNSSMETRSPLEVPDYLGPAARP